LIQKADFFSFNLKAEISEYLTAFDANQNFDLIDNGSPGGFGDSDLSNQQTIEMISHDQSIPSHITGEYMGL